MFYLSILYIGLVCNLLTNTSSNYDILMCKDIICKIPYPSPHSTLKYSHISGVIRLK